MISTYDTKRMQCSKSSSSSQLFLRKGVSALTGRYPITMAFASFDLQNERVVAALDYAGSETNNIEALKDSNGKIARVAAANDNSAHIFQVDGTFCKVLYTNRGQAKSFQQLGDGALVVGTTQGRVAIYSRDVVFGSCDYPVADVILSSHQVMDPVDSMMTMADGTVVQVGPYRDPHVEIFYGEDIRGAVNTQGSTVEIQPSAVIKFPTSTWTLFGFGNNILVTTRDGFGDIAKQFCILNTSQLKKLNSKGVVDSNSACKWINLPLTPDGRSRLGTPRFTSLSDSSFVVLSPGMKWYNTTKSQSDDAPFKVQRYDQDEDLDWALSLSIDGQVRGESNSIVTIHDECVVFPLVPDVSGELYFANVGTNDFTTTLTFPSNVVDIDTIDDQLAVATVDFDSSSGQLLTVGHVYMLDKIDMSSCGYDATQLDSVKGFSTNDGKFDVAEKLQDNGSYAISASYGGSRRILMYESGPQLPFTEPDYYINTLLNGHVTTIDEFAAPGPEDLNLVVYGERGTGGVFYPEAHPAHNGRYGSLVRRIE